MLEEAAQELLRREGHGALLAAVRIVLPAKSDLGVGDREQAMVGDGDPVGITGQIVKDMLGSAEGRLGIDDPLLLEVTERSAVMSQEKYIGMDVHQATISVAVTDSRGKLIMESILETKATTILEFINGDGSLGFPPCGESVSRLRKQNQQYSRIPRSDAEHRKRRVAHHGVG